jgi:hypothetical protein
MPNTGQRPLLCPSARAEDGAELFAVAGADGTVHHLPEPIAVTPEFLALVAPERAERRFRFSAPCREAACAQWTDGRCGLPERLAALVPESEAAAAPRRCALRPHCRWFRQSGLAACTICPVVLASDGAE